jgi:hypothetical protein
MKKPRLGLGGRFTCVFRERVSSLGRSQHSVLSIAYRKSAIGSIFLPRISAIGFRCGSSSHCPGICERLIESCPIIDRFCPERRSILPKPETSSYQGLSQTETYNIVGRSAKLIFGSSDLIVQTLDFSYWLN